MGDSRIMSHNMSVFKKDGDSEGDSGFVTPDSTTKLPQFVEGEDVLSHGKDGLFYLGTIVMVDSENERCMVQFQDSTAHWSLYKDLAKLKLPDSADVCIICKSSNRWDSNEIILCCICQQGYHQDCVQPCIGIEYCDVESQWECPCCLRNSSKEGKESKMLSSQSGKSKKRSSLPSVELQHDSKLVLPYHIKSLTWDQGHKSNREQTYCYCGGPGEWYNRMLQCQRCKQWFHEACVDCLHYSLLYGDRFYIFVCELCNDSVEFLHRLDVKWVDVVHLAIFNLTLQDSKTYFEYEETITQWINDSWELLQCPLALQNIPVNLRKQEVLRVLEGNRPRFKCGREIKKKTSLWGLRIRIPPPVQAFTLPQGGITYETIKQITFRNKKNRNEESPPIPRTYRIREEKQEEVDKNIIRFSPAKKRAMSPSAITFDDDSPKSEKIRKKRKREVDSLVEEGKDELDSGLGSRELRRHNQEELTEDSHVVNLNKQDQKSSLQRVLQDRTVVAVKRKRGRPPKNDVKNDKPRHIRDLGDLNHKRAEKLLKEALKQGSGGLSLRQMSVDGGLSPVSVTPSGETSGDDSSSHGTLASFIPPPSNFEGYNNPFLNLDTQWLTASPVVRIHKRQLIENDLRYDKNGDVKHRKFRRKFEKSVKVQNVGGTIGLNGCVPTGVQINDTTYNKGCDEFAVNGRLPESPNKEDCDRVNKDSTKMINSALSFSDLKSSVKDFFGAANRIANGEKFNIIARRVSAHNKVQYLIEWDTPSSS